MAMPLDRLAPRRPAMRRTLHRALARLAALALLLGGCTIATPYREAGRETGTGPGDDAAPVIVALTEARLSGGRAGRARFWQGVRDVERTLPSQPGLLGWRMRRELLGDTAWTMTVWESEEDLLRFVGSPAHRAAIGAGSPALASARFARLTRERGAGPPSWEEALDVLARRGQGYR